MTNEIDNLKQKADNTTEIADMQNKMNALEKEIAKLRRTVEVGDTFSSNLCYLIRCFIKH